LSRGLDSLVQRAKMKALSPTERNQLSVIVPNPP
jgi:hypothetical protein